MLAKQETIDMKDLSLCLLDLLCTSCQIIHTFSKDAQLSWKGKNNPVTEIDYMIQHFIVDGLKSNYATSIAIVGQEDLSSSTCPELKANISNKLSVFKGKENLVYLPKAVEFHQTYPAKDLCIWIDPLDCTQGFINERRHEVTILVGISYKGVPICGLIAHPYKLTEPNSKKSAIYSPSVFYGSAELKLNSAFEFKLEENRWETISGVESEGGESLGIEKLTILGYRKMSLRQERVVKEVGLRVVRAGGAGYKCLKLITKEVGSLMFIDAKTSKWDTCAGEAIIKAMGGFTASQDLSQIEYLPDQSFENSGFIFSLYANLLVQVAKAAS